MRARGFSLLLILLADPAAADTLVAVRTLRAHSLLSAEDVALVGGSVAGAAGALSDVVGFETRVAVYQGQPIFRKILGPAAVIERNQTVRLAFQSGTLTILSDGRALARGGVGDQIRVMNIASRTTVTGVIDSDGTVRVDAAD